MCTFFNRLFILRGLIRRLTNYLNRFLCGLSSDRFTWLWFDCINWCVDILDLWFLIRTLLRLSHRLTNSRFKLWIFFDFNDWSLYLLRQRLRNWFYFLFLFDRLFFNFSWRNILLVYSSLNVLLGWFLGVYFDRLIDMLSFFSQLSKVFFVQYIQILS